MAGWQGNAANARLNFGQSGAGGSTDDRTVMRAAAKGVKTSCENQADSYNACAGGALSAPGAPFNPGYGAADTPTTPRHPQRRSLAGRCGIPRECERVYVAVDLADVNVAPGRLGTRPAGVRWPDGRAWQIRGIYTSQRFGRAEFGNLCERWDVEIQGRRVTLWHENGSWFVEKGSGLAA